MTSKSFVQDNNGQWHYINPDGTRRKATLRLCGYCKKEFPFVTFGEKYKGLYCSTACANKAPKPRRNVRGKSHPNWKGGKSMSHGYVLVRVGNSYKLEHRLVMERVLGRELTRYEQVHHKNGDKTDNRIKNLELRSGPHGRGATEKHCPTCTCFEHFK